MAADLPALDSEPPIGCGAGWSSITRPLPASGSSATKATAARRQSNYEDIVREALCFGWIDSLVKRLDNDRYAIKLTPRRATSKWSPSNRKRWSELRAAGLLAETRERRIRESIRLLASGRTLGLK